MKKGIILTFLILGVSFYCFGEEIQDSPEWFDRVELSAQYETDAKPSFFLQTVQPLYQSADEYETVFYQPRVSLRSGDLTYNLGIGYRKIVRDNLLLGVNLFGDYEDRHGHGRLGVGFEALGQVLEARLNTYIALTNKRLVNETSTSSTYERVADGLDFELGMPIPYLPWLKFYTSGFWYDFDKFSDKVGWKTRLEAELNDALTLEVYTWDDNKGDIELGGRLCLNIAFDKLVDFKEAFTFASEPFPEKDLTESMLIPVERNFDIVVEKWTETASATIEVKRGN